MIATPAHAATFERKQLVFGDIELTIRIDTTLPRDRAYREIDKGFVIARKQDEIFSTYKADSEITRLNSIPKPARGIKISRAMSEVLEKALHFTKQTDGYFDLTYEMETSGAKNILLLKNRKIDLLNKNLRINPTGVVKGDTADRILTALKRNKRISGALVAVGGDIARFDRFSSTESISLHNPLPKHIHGKTVIIGNGAVSTSGQYERSRHIKNTRRSPIEHLQVSVIAPDCTTSDGLDNAFLFMPAGKIQEVLKSFPGTRVILYEKNGTKIEL